MVSGRNFAAIVFKGMRRLRGKLRSVLNNLSRWETMNGQRVDSPEQEMPTRRGLSLVRLASVTSAPGRLPKRRPRRRGLTS